MYSFGHLNHFSCLEAEVENELNTSGNGGEDIGSENSETTEVDLVVRTAMKEANKETNLQKSPNRPKRSYHEVSDPEPDDKAAETETEEGKQGELYLLALAMRLPDATCSRTKTTTDGVRYVENPRIIYHSA